MILFSLTSIDIIRKIVFVVILSHIMNYTSYITSFQTKKLNRISFIRRMSSSIDTITTNPTKINKKFISHVYQGDSTFRDSYKRAGIGPGLLQADVIITDPPYCLLERRRTGGDLRDPKPRQRKLDNQPTVPRFESVNAYKEFTSKWLSLTIELAAKKETTLIIWTNALGKTPIITISNSLGYDFVGEYLWAKRTVDQVKENSTKNEVLLRVYETALIFQPKDLAKITKTRKPSSSDRSLMWSVITGYHDHDKDINNGSVSGPHLHPCHKPYTAMEPLIRQWTKPNDVIFDPFCGSGGILYSAARIGDRKIIGIEKLEEWVKYSNEIIHSLESRGNT